jgi:hypothetical protein
LLREQVKELAEKSWNDEYTLKEKLAEKDEAIRSITEKYDSELAVLKDAIRDLHL